MLLPARALRRALPLVLWSLLTAAGAGADRLPLKVFDSAGGLAGDAVQSIAYKSEITPLFERWLYDPLLALIQRLARLVRHLQAGSLHLYLAYVTVVLVILLLAARWYS